MDVRIYDEPVCNPAHDTFALVLTTFLCLGTLLSYIPQHYRIIAQKTSEGLSPWYLLLGSTSSAAGMLNVITLQWGVVRCCAVWSIGACLENTIGILQVGIVWFMFTFIVVLFLVYYPPAARHHHIRSAHAAPEYTDDDAAERGAEEEEEAIEELLVATAEWNEAKALCALVFVHLVICIFVTFFLVLSSPPPSPSSPGQQAELWAGFLGITASLLACFQYAPQLYKTYTDKLVGALSIPTMFIQVPGAVLFVVSLAIREGTNWTSWLPYAAAGVMQGMLLVMCLIWKARQSRLGVDDFGNPLVLGSPEVGVFTIGAAEHGGTEEEGVTPELEGGDAVDEMVVAGEDGEEAERAVVDEQTPLMVRTSKQTGKLIMPWFSWGRDSK
ncbi:hypothetical protein CALCODRAFT_493886 [Calocera cornea HHB12733]|uniref:PQ-loop-domain-containing protein n=1 Tax=Calocera cornea HHB12733 TaxID=1353952 RepID=A0A165HHN9_9BASI|nr:hypothetical protein CALCODRAFT_493886 [Calocera cornea HHB12733]